MALPSRSPPRQLALGLVEAVATLGGPDLAVAAEAEVAVQEQATVESAFSEEAEAHVVEAAVKVAAEEAAMA